MIRFSTLLLICLAACAGPEPADPVEALQDALAQQQADAGATQAAAPRAGAASPVQRAGATQAALPGTPPAQARQLIGHAPETVLGWLGEPRIRRPEGEAEVWHYTASGCHLDLIFYREPAGLRVGFAQARAMGAAQRPEGACLRDLSRAPGARVRTGAPGA
jgi:hypothetical protein